MAGLKENTTKNSQEKNPSTVKTKFSSYWSIALLILLVGIAYQPILFDFFLGDDFVHLIWLKQALQNPELILRNFSHNWLDITTTSFYRPLISVFMASDYFFWGTNGLGFHITNLFFHLVATMAIFFLAKGIYEDAFQEANGDGYALIAALIFGLYPLHCEAVSWITGRVDSVVTAFICLALLFFRTWRVKQQTTYLVLTVLCMTLGLLSKEMAITLPAMFFAYSFFLEKKGETLLSLKSFLYALKASAPFFLILVIYFVIRRFALGTFIGGYDDSLLPLANLKHFFATWIHALRMFLIPLNREVIPSSNPLTITWIVTLVITGTLYLYNLLKLKNTRALSFFTISLLVFALIPVYKLFAIGNDLQGSRLAHVATVAISFILATAFIKKPSETPFLRYFKIVIAACYLVLCFFALRINNGVWAEAGVEVNKIRTALATQYKEIEGDPQVLLLNLPDNIHGAYACRNALDGITKTPQFPRDINNCLQVSAYEPIVPIGFLKDSIIQNSEKIKVFSWTENNFVQVKLNTSIKNEGKTWQDEELDSIIESSNNGKNILVNLENENLFCSEIDLLALKVENIGDDVVMQFTTDIAQKFSRENSLVRDRKNNKTLYFSLSPRPAWLFGNSPRKLLISSASPIKLKSITVLNKSKLMPALAFENSGYLGSKGYLHLNQESEKSGQITVDSSNVINAKKSRVEISKPNKFFTVMNSASMQPEVLLQVDAPLKGQFRIERSQFPSDGIYELRCWALDSGNNPVGLASDHIVISVDN